jgi:hypothetical protein
MDENVEQSGQEEEVDRRQGLADQRTNAVDRRAGADRRSGWDRRRGPGRRRTDERRSAEEGEMNDEQFEFIMAIEEYKRVNHKPFPSYTEILEIAKALGYRRVAERQALNLKQDE